MEKQTTVTKSKDEILYERRVKAMELAIKAQKNMHSDTIVKVATAIFIWLNKKD